jgi:hypothetical protein
MDWFPEAQKNVSLRASPAGASMGLYSKIWRFGAKIHLQQGL